MNDSIKRGSTETGIIEHTRPASSFSVEKYDIETGDLKTGEISDFQEGIRTAGTVTGENYINRKRLKSLKRRFTHQLLSLLIEENFEYGIDTKADALVRNQMQLNSLATKAWLNSIFVENFANTPIAVGLLRIIARIDYLDIFPEGQTMAMAALSHKNIEVQEGGVRAFESWDSLRSLEILKNLRVSTEWLQEYIDEVVSNLRKEYKEYNVIIHKED